MSIFAQQYPVCRLVANQVTRTNASVLPDVITKPRADMFNSILLRGEETEKNDKEQARRNKIPDWSPTDPLIGLTKYAWP
jgi:hypothetical protein